MFKKNLNLYFKNIFQNVKIKIFTQNPYIKILFLVKIKL